MHTDTHTYTYTCIYVFGCNSIKDEFFFASAAALVATDTVGATCLSVHSLMTQLQLAGLLTHKTLTHTLAHTHRRTHTRAHARTHTRLQRDESRANACIFAYITSKKNS